MKAWLPWTLGLVAAACSGSRSSSPPLLAAATIGPEGGVLEVVQGTQAGLRLTVPPGALAAPTELRVLDVTHWAPTGTLATSTVPPPGHPFLLEPVGLQFGQPVTLRAPYEVRRIMHTSPGNVRARQTRNGNHVDHDPAVVDVLRGHVELPIGVLSRFQVIQGPAAQQIAEYFQPTGTTVELTDGWSFAVEEVPLSSPFQPTTMPRWRITGPQLPLGQDVDLLYFNSEGMVGRESTDENWREVWSQPYPVWTPAWLSPDAVTMPMQVSVPMSGPGIGGQITVFGAWTWAPPRRIGDRLLYDVVQLHLALAWNRADLGVGQRDYRFWFAPGIGLVAFGEDGLEHVRTAL